MISIEKKAINIGSNSSFNKTKSGPIKLRNANPYWLDWEYGNINDDVEDRLFKDIKEDVIRFDKSITDGNPGDGKSTLGEHFIRVAYDRYGKDNVNVIKLEQAYHSFFLFDDKPVQYFIVDDAMTKKIHQKYVAYMMEFRHAYEKDDPKWDILDHTPNKECNIIFAWLIQDIFSLHRSIRKIGNSYFFKSYPGSKSDRVALACDFITHRGLDVLKKISNEVNQRDIQESKSKTLFGGLDWAGVYRSKFVHKRDFTPVTRVSPEVDKVALDLCAGQKVLKL